MAIGSQHSQPSGPHSPVHVVSGTGVGAPEGDDQGFELSSSTDGKNLDATGAHIPMGQDQARSNISTVLEVDSTIGAFIVQKKLGQGAMGAVYLVLNPLSNRRSALKVMAGKYVDDSQAKLRFIKEIRAVHQIDNPHVVKAEHAEILPDGRAIFVAEFVPGGDLSKKIGKPLPVNEVMRYGKQIALGVSAAHEKGIVHRDLKPANIFLTEEGSVKVGDFGLAKLTDNEFGAQTEDGTTLGTPRYISPQAISDSKLVDEKADVYALGCILYELLTSKFPHFEELEGRSDNTAALSLFHARQSGKLPTDVRKLRGQIDISADELPPAFEELIKRMISFTPNARPTMSEVVAALDAMELGRPYEFGQLLETVEQRQSAVGTLGRVSTPRSRLRTAVFALLGLVTTGGVAGYAYLHSGDQNKASISESPLPSSKALSPDQPTARSSDVLRNVSAHSGAPSPQPHSLDPEKLQPDTLLTIEEKDGIKIYRLRSGADDQGTAQCGSEWHHPNDSSKRTASTLFFSVDQYRAYLGLSDDAPLPLEKYGDGVDTFVYELDDGTSLHTDQKSQTLIYYPKNGKPIVYSNDASVRDSLKATGRYSVSDEGVMGAPKNPDLFVSMRTWKMNLDEDPERMVGKNNERRAYTGPMQGLMDWLRIEGEKIHKASTVDVTSVK